MQTITIAPYLSILLLINYMHFRHWKTNKIFTNSKKQTKINSSSDRRQ